ncbi:MAG: hypothetical protein IGBAC_0084 [Ignavibacteriae bacterium]|nr:MAG: hypothetical protein IGBAC_0084 [Ignavibacteriota bacterium]
MKSWFWTLLGIGIGAAITYILLKQEKEEKNEGYPLFMMRKAKGTINDQVYAGVEVNDEEEWI